MDDKLQDLLISLIQEQQIKLGYEKETLRFYFPESSMPGICEVEDVKQLSDYLKKFKQQCKKILGEVRITKQGERFCITIPPEGNEYVWEKVPRDEFLVEWIELFRKHDICIEELKNLFGKYAKDFTCKEHQGKEFDYIMHFEQGKRAQFYYMIQLSDGHPSYHRFTKRDLESVL